LVFNKPSFALLLAAPNVVVCPLLALSGPPAQTNVKIGGKADMMQTGRYVG
jgi:hypothetical protein